MSRARPAVLCLWVLLAFPTTALACASCGCGDPTLTAMGMEKPFKHRIRLSLEQRLGEHDTRDERTLITRTALSGSYSPTSWLSVGALLPLVATWSLAPGRDARAVYGLGDLELLARALVLRDRSFSPRHLGGILLGLKFPTGPRRSDERGYPAPDDQQPGSGSWDGLFGVGYSYFGDSLALFVSASYRLTRSGYRDYQRGSSLGVSALLQLPIGTRLAAITGVELGHTRRSLLPGGVPAPDTGGSVLALSYGLLISLRTDWLLRFAVQTPVLQAWYGVQKESPTAVLSLVVDF